MQSRPWFENATRHEPGTIRFQELEIDRDTPQHLTERAGRVDRATGVLKRAEMVTSTSLFCFRKQYYTKCRVEGTCLNHSICIGRMPLSTSVARGAFMIH